MGPKHSVNKTVASYTVSLF